MGGLGQPGFGANAWARTWVEKGGYDNGKDRDTVCVFGVSGTLCRVEAGK
jgi:hypothetical protein